jgi:predicted 3-demethylubiquinone-9 3-methyltransferase (glyoxalase superfamily)
MAHDAGRRIEPPGGPRLGASKRGAPEGTLWLTRRTRDMSKSKIYTCLWSNDKATEMARFYKSIFKGTKVGKTAYWGQNPMRVKEGSVLTMHITLLGQKIMLLNGFAKMEFTDAISFIVPCKNQREIDTYWKKLLKGGGKPVACGWLIDKYGVRWQITPGEFDKWNTAKNTKKRDAVMRAMWDMVKLDHAKLRKAFDSA